jgi:hypothetical protein
LVKDQSHDHDGEPNRRPIPADASIGVRDATASAYAGSVNRPDRPKPTPTGAGSTGQDSVLGEAAPTTSPRLSSRALALGGTACWSVALVVVLAVPDLHRGERSWWPWTCVCGIALGVFAWWFVRRGKGNAFGA